MPVVLAVGRQERQKGFDLLLEAMPGIRREVPDAQLLVAGRRGSASEALENQVSRLGLDGSVRWLGHRSDIPDLLAACDVMVFPSRWEGLGSAVIEAIMLETPVVCSDLAVLREVVGAAHATACVGLVDAEEPASLAAAVVEKIRAPSPYDDGGNLGMTPFLLEVVATGYARLVHECVADRGPGRSEEFVDEKPGAPESPRRSASSSARTD